jgi:hypothetical protein
MRHILRVAHILIFIIYAIIMLMPYYGSPYALTINGLIIKNNYIDNAVYNVTLVAKDLNDVMTFNDFGKLIKQNAR